MLETKIAEGSCTPCPGVALGEGGLTTVPAFPVTFYMNTNKILHHK